MKTVSISGSQRENVGKKDAKSVRKEGLVPAVIYGGKEQITLTVDEKDILKIINTPEVATLKLKIGDIEKSCIIKDKQFHPVTDRILHVDFQEIFENKPVTIGIPVKVSGVSPGVLAGGKLQLKLRKLKVKGFYTKFPDFINIDISSLELGQSIKVGSLQYDGLEFLDNASSVVAIIKLTRGAISAAQEVEETKK